jgi:hypothetical protein
MSDFKKIFFIAAIFPLMSLIFVGRVHAQCEPVKQLYDNTAANFGPNLERTSGNWNNAMMNIAFSYVPGVDITTATNCLGYVVGQIQPGSPLADCNATPQATCEEITNALSYTDDPGSAVKRFAKGRVAGSLLGAAYTLDNYNRYAPLPVNLAVFWNDAISKVPLANKALAADVNYQHALIDSILNIWKAIRNIAYALMSIVLLVVGLMIILRKRINQQVVVTIQYSLPRIVIALILIAFSYPIGATMTSLGWTVFHSANKILIPLVPTAPVSLSNGGLTAGTLVLAIVATGLVAGMGVINFALIIIVSIIAAALFLYFQFKVLATYLKMIFSILSAPIEFVIGAIPGSEDRIWLWFKKMAAYMLSLFALGGIQTVVNLLGYNLIVEYINQLSSGNVASDLGLGFIIGIVAPAFVFIYGYSVAIGMPAKVEKLLIGEPGKPRR